LSAWAEICQSCQVGLFNPVRVRFSRVWRRRPVGVDPQRLMTATDGLKSPLLPPHRRGRTVSVSDFRRDAAVRWATGVADFLRVNQCAHAAADGRPLVEIAPSQTAATRITATRPIDSCARCLVAIADLTLTRTARYSVLSSSLVFQSFARHFSSPLGPLFAATLPFSRHLVLS
jgi:hypothetical protein